MPIKCSSTQVASSEPTRFICVRAAPLSLGEAFDTREQRRRKRAAAASLRHLDTIGLDVSRRDDPAPADAAALDGWRILRLERVSYRYPDSSDSPFAFGPLDFTR